MWPRVAEFMLACWLIASPFIFRHTGDDLYAWIFDFSAAAAIMVLSLASFWPPLRKAHLLILLVAVWMAGYPMLFAERPVDPALQNHIGLGLLLMMVALVPSEATRPPLAWRKRMRESKDVPAAVPRRRSGQAERETTESEIESQPVHPGWMKE